MLLNGSKRADAFNAFDIAGSERSKHSGINLFINVSCVASFIKEKFGAK